MTAAERLDIHLNSDNWFRRADSTSGPFFYSGVRQHFKMENGITISIQQSDIHWCGIGSVELYNCPWHESQTPKGRRAKIPDSCTTVWRTATYHPSIWPASA
jgi:hypothetical protein